MKTRENQREGQKERLDIETRNKDLKIALQE